jgi:hypothetical protein
VTTQRWQVSWLAGPGAHPAFPGLQAQWHYGRVLAAYSCGGSCGITPRSLLIPEGNHRNQR